jgi:hypothetical protein
MQRKTNRCWWWAGIGLVAALASGCSSSSNQVKDDVVSMDHPWIEPSPILEQQLDDEASRLPWTHGFERLEQIRWFASVGEPAYTKLLELACDERDDVAAGALAALGATGDRRLVSFIHELDWSVERYSGDLGLERARTLVRLGDWSEIPILISGLSDERLYTRSLCQEALQEATHETLDYDPRAELDERNRAAKRWQAWWETRSGEGLVQGR